MLQGLARRLVGDEILFVLATLSPFLLQLS